MLCHKQQEGWQLWLQGFGVVVPLHQMLHPLSAPSWTLFRCCQRQHLDIRVSQVVEVAVVTGSSPFEQDVSVYVCGQVGH